MQDQFISAVIAAAGLGSRMNACMNKNFMLLNNKPILSYSLTTFDKCPDIDEIIIVCKADEKNTAEEIVQLTELSKMVKIISGGETRQQSVYNGLCAADKQCTIAVIHDRARPFVTSKLIEQTVRTSIKYGASCAAVKAKDTYILGKNNKIFELLDREELYSLQTPQTFRYELIKQAHEASIKNHFLGTDDTSLVKILGADVVLVEGSYDNIKITTSEDLILAEMILNRK